MSAARLDTHLKQSSALPRDLLARAARLAELDRALALWLAPRGPWARQVSLANIRAPQATLIVSSATAATPLRYCQQDLLSWLSEQAGEQLSRLQISVQALPGRREGGV